MPGCQDLHDYERDIWYYCTPNGSTFYTPDGLDPTAGGPEYGGGCDPYGGSPKPCPTVAANRYEWAEEGPMIPDPGPGGTTIPSPAPFSYSRDYCSDPWFAQSAFEDLFQRSCYNHDVCYGSQLGRTYCDTRFWRDVSAACYTIVRYHSGIAYRIQYRQCLYDGRQWYTGIRLFGASHYKPRKSSNQP